MIPSREECIALMKRCEMLPNIFEHSLKVSQVALYLTSRLIERGAELDSQEIEAAALLHDITKTRSLKTRENHAVTGCLVLKELGYERIGEIVRGHITSNEEVSPGEITAEEVVSYADKRVLHDRVVSLEERFSDLRRRYGRGEEGLRRIRILKTWSLKVERKILSKLDMDPRDLDDL
jgi:putative nucleotidyltransferase with HDIG domain